MLRRISNLFKKPRDSVSRRSKISGETSDEYKSLLIFAVRGQEVATLSYSTSSKDDVQSLVQVGLGLTFGESKPVPNPDEYVVIEWDTLKVIPKTVEISKIGGPSIVLLLPNTPLPELQDAAVNVKEWVMSSEMRREVEKHFQSLAIWEWVRQHRK